MKSTMQQVPLTVGRLLNHAVTTHPTAEVITSTGTGVRRITFAELGQRSARLANALRGLGVTGDQRVGTFLWNNAEHLEAYAAVPAMGAVLHTVNIRLSQQQMVFVIGHAEDRVLVVDGSLVDSLIERAGPTLTAAVPTVWSDVLAHLRSHGGDLSSLRLMLGGGAPVPVSLQQDMADVAGILMLQAWGMTETSPTALVGWPPVDASDPGFWSFRAKQGRILSSVEARIVGDDGTTLTRDGRSVGELEVRGPFVTAGYYRVDTPDLLHDGWLRTGDVGTIDELGFVRLTDRAKDIIKSGGEWISSVELESAVVSHPAVREAAVIGIPDDRWQERPLAIVALHPDAEVTVADLQHHLSESVVKWQIPEAWVFVDSIPKTSVGKYDKKRMRTMHRDHELTIEGTAGASGEATIRV